MKETFDIIFPLLIESEGTKYTDDPIDPGGATKYGITFSRLQLWRGKKITKDDVKSLSLDEARQIYLSHYWGFIRADSLPAGLDYTVFDFAVNSGPTRSVRMLQNMIGSKPDGDYGPATHIALEEYIKNTGLIPTIRRFNTGRRNYLKGLGTFWKYGRGWMARVDRVEHKSVELANSN
jgi:lysozyme family protein